MYNRITILAAPVISGTLLALPWLGQSSFFSLFALVPLFRVIFSNKETDKQRPFAKLLSIVLTFLIWNMLSNLGWSNHCHWHQHLADGTPYRSRANIHPKTKSSNTASLVFFGMDCF